MFQMLLMGAQVGMSIFGARESNKAAKKQARMAGQQAGVTAGQAVFGGKMERFQIRNQARYEESLRRRGFAQSIGTQRAASSAAGIIGGRTQQLIESRSQAAFTREQGQARFNEDMAISSSQYRQESSVQAARYGGAQAAMQANQVRKQNTMNFMGDMIGVGKQGYALWEQRQAGT